MDKARIKQNVVPLLALIFSLISLLCVLNLLTSYNYTLVSFARAVTWDDNQIVKSAVNRSTESAIFTRSENVYVSGDWNKGAFVTVYSCSDKYFEISKLPRINGRFLWDSDSRDRKNYAVIDENLAVLMFAGKNCIGEIITVGRVEYSIIGVCGAEDGVLTSVEEYAVYLPIDAYSTQNTQGGCLLRTQNDIELTFALQKGIMTSGGIRSIDNLKVRSGMWSMPARLALLIIYFMTLVCAVKILVKYLALQLSKARIELEGMYTIQYLREHSLFVGMHLAAFIVLCVVFMIWFRVVSFTVIIDAELIPHNLIDVMGWVDNITVYTRSRNAAQNIPFSPSYQISVYGWVATMSSIVCICAACKLLQNLRVWIYEILKGLDILR